MGRTQHFGFATVGPNDNFSDDGYKFSVRDRQDIDTAIYASMQHMHDGASLSDIDASTGPELGLSDQGLLLGASLLSDTRYYYKITLVDAFGRESEASVEEYIDTPAAVDEPGQPGLSYTTTGGTLLSGTYLYAVSAYTNFNTSETLIGTPASIAVPAVSSTNTIVVDLPSLPDDATGFNIYQQKPGGQGFYYLASVDMTIATPPTEYVDDGSDECDCNRTLPTVNNTLEGIAVDVTYPGATPVVPVGYTWKVYRTERPGDWDNSLVHHVVEETSEGSGVITPTYIDVGSLNIGGTPPERGMFAISNPEKILLTDSAHVQGVLPLDKLNSLYVITIQDDGPLVNGELDKAVSVFIESQLFAAVASLGRNSTSSEDITIRLQRSRDGGFSYDDIFDVLIASGDRAGIQFASSMSGITWTEALMLTQLGDIWSAEIITDGSGATPEEFNLRLDLYFMPRNDGIIGFSGVSLITGVDWSESLT